MNLLRATRKCYINLPARSYPLYVSPTVSNHTRLKQAPRRFYSEEKGKEKESHPNLNDSSRTNLSQDNSASTKTESEATDSQKSNREGEFLAQLQAKQDEITELTASYWHTFMMFHLLTFPASGSTAICPSGFYKFATDISP